MKSALLVIDVQESFRQRPYWQDQELQPFLFNVQALADDCARRRIPVLQIFHCEPPASVSNPFALESGHVRTLRGLQLQPTALFHKRVHSALFGRSASGLTLEQWLQRHDIQELLVTGIRTEQCCETTTRHASDLGYAVRYVSDATLTFPMQSRSGRWFSPAELRERTELVLDGRFAQVISTAEALASGTAWLERSSA
ncbi:MAG: isochorismatase family protein [Sinobacteraceae bacterium]|nr:isochorismatase family protein [Nevskiaceae bacterium]